MGPSLGGLGGALGGLVLGPLAGTIVRRTPLLGSLEVQVRV